MKYWSETLKKVFETEADCIAAEKDFKEKADAEEKQKKERAEARKARAKEVEDAYKSFIDAQKHYNELKNKFIKDFGSFHMTFSTTNDDICSLFNELCRFF